LPFVFSCWFSRIGKFVSGETFVREVGPIIYVKRVCGEERSSVPKRDMSFPENYVPSHIYVGILLYTYLVETLSFILKRFLSHQNIDSAPSAA